MWLCVFVCISPFLNDVCSPDIHRNNMGCVSTKRSRRLYTHYVCALRNVLSIWGRGPTVFTTLDLFGKHHGVRQAVTFNVILNVYVPPTFTVTVASTLLPFDRV